MKLILAFFGYTKIPLELIQLSITNELIFEIMVESSEMEEIKDKLEQALEGQKTLTKFLRSGRKLGR